MSINVDKMDPKSVASPRKSKTLKRRKKTSSMSDLSIGSISPKRKSYTNKFSEENLSSPEVSSRDSPFSPPGAFNELFRYSYNLPQNGENSRKISSTDMPTSQENTQSDDGSNRSIDYTNGLVTEQTDSIRHSDTMNHNNGTDSDSNASVNRGKRRTTEDFYLFCQIILEYENYNGIANQEALRNSTHSPLDSTGSVTESTTSSAANEESNQVIDNNDASKDDSVKEVNISNSLDENELDASKNISAMDVSSANDDITDESDIDADSYNLITCYCGKPYAARPMIECSQCLTWLHLSCAKVKRKHIPDIFICAKCVKSGHPKDLQGCEPKENNRSKRSSNSTQTRSDKLENTILQPLNVEASYETSTKCLENIKSSSMASISVKYK